MIYMIGVTDMGGMMGIMDMLEMLEMTDMMDVWFFLGILGRASIMQGWSCVGLGRVWQR
jgi:hypothetical protein